MSWLSKAVSHPANVVKALVNPVGAGIEKLTGISQEKQLMMGAGIGAGVYGLGKAGVLGATSAAGPVYGPQMAPSAATGTLSTASSGSSFNPWSFAAPVIGAGADIWSAQKMSQGQSEANATNLESAREQMAFQASQTQQQENFQENMSNTAHQREVADLKAAGLNPVLSANSGASTPVGASGSGAMATVQNAAPNYGGIVPKGIDSAVKLAQMKKDFEATDSSIALQHASAYREAANAKVAMNSARQVGAEADMAEMQRDIVKKNPKTREFGWWIKQMSPFTGSAQELKAFAQ